MTGAELVAGVAIMISLAGLALLRTSHTRQVRAIDRAHAELDQLRRDREAWQTSLGQELASSRDELMAKVDELIAARSLETVDEVAAMLREVLAKVHTDVIVQVAATVEATQA